MAEPYIPRRDADLDNFLLNFSTLIAAKPSDYALDAADAAIISGAYAAWHAAFLLAREPATRTRPTVNAKDGQRRAVIAIVRRYATLIRADTTISHALQIGLGLNPPRRTQSRIAPPHETPLIMVKDMDMGTHTLSTGVSEESRRRGKPPNTVGLLLFRAIADGPVLNPRGSEFLGFVTTGRFTSTFEHGDNGKTATYFARWTNAKGEMGPWSTPSSMRIAA